MVSAKDSIDLLKSIKQETFEGDEDGRRNALNEARLLVGRLENPSEKVINLVRTETVVLGAVQVAVDSGMFTALGTSLSAENLKGKTLDEIAAATKVDKRLAKRTLRVLTGDGFVTELAEESPVRYAPTAFSATMTHPFSADYLTFHHRIIGDVYWALPAFLRSTNYQNPDSLEHATWQFQRGAGSDFFHWVDTQPETKRMFHNMMSFFTVRDILAATNGDTRNKLQLSWQTEQKAAPNNIQWVYSLLDGPSGRVVLQDRAHVVDMALATTLSYSGVEGHGQSFFEPVPAALAGARFYYVSSILHDWPDAECVKILGVLAKAMAPGYSQLVLHELVVPETNPPPLKSAMDWWMMTVYSAGERTLAEFEELLAQVGLKVVTVLAAPEDYRETVVCELI